MTAFPVRSPRSWVTSVRFRCVHFSRPSFLSHLGCSRCAPHVPGRLHNRAVLARVSSAFLVPVPTRVSSCFHRSRVSSCFLRCYLPRSSTAAFLGVRSSQPSVFSGPWPLSVAAPSVISCFPAALLHLVSWPFQFEAAHRPTEATLFPLWNSFSEIFWDTQKFNKWTYKKLKYKQYIRDGGSKRTRCTLEENMSIPTTVSMTRWPK